MRTNVAARQTATTHEGATAGPSRPLDELRRTVSTCLLWEDAFYEGGDSVASRIAKLCEAVKPEDIAALAVEARGPMRLRHVPLFLACQLARVARGQSVVGDTIAAVIQRPDELAELLALYWKDGRRPLSAQVKRGLRKAFAKFGEQALSKWNRDGEVKLRDVLFLCHAKPKDEEQAAVWKRLIAGELAPADTWEVALSSGADKRETWTRLLSEGKLGYMALLMNLRNMADAGVDRALVDGALRDGAAGSKALPFRFVSAAKAAPQYAAALSDAMALCVTGQIEGSTALVVDISGSMDAPVSAKSQLLRWEAAGALGVMLAQMAPSFRCFTFSHSLVEVMALRGLGLLQGITNSQPHGGTMLRASLAEVQRLLPAVDRVVVVTDEQSQDGMHPAWAPRSYLINVAPYQNGVDQTQGWKRINGFSERTLEWIVAQEQSEAVA